MADVGGGIEDYLNQCGKAHIELGILIAKYPKVTDGDWHELIDDNSKGFKKQGMVKEIVEDEERRAGLRPRDKGDDEEREDLIQKIEGCTGTLHSVPYRSITTHDLRKIYGALLVGHY